MWRRIALVSVGVFLTLPATAAACSCVGPRSALGATSAELIVRGDIVRMERRTPPASPDQYGYAVEVEVEVRSSWRGQTEERIVFVSEFDGGDCGYPFRIGFEYVIPLYRTASGEWGAGCCAGVQSIREARSMLPELGPGYRPAAHPRAGWILLAQLYSIIALSVLGVLGWQLYLRPGPR